jgi:circadian clock protein KaiC
MENYSLSKVDAAEISPGEFADKVRSCVEKEAIRTVIIDSLNGYQNAMPEEKFLILHMHELLQYLNRLGAATFLTVAQHGLVGDMKAPVDVTYLADTVLVLRYFEAFGQVRRASPCLKSEPGGTKTPFVSSVLVTLGSRSALPSISSRASCAAFHNMWAKRIRSLEYSAR